MKKSPVVTSTKLRCGYTVDGTSGWTDGKEATDIVQKYFLWSSRNRRSSFLESFLESWLERQSPLSVHHSSLLSSVIDHHSGLNCQLSTMSNQLLQLDDYLLKKIFKYCSLLELLELSAVSLRLGKIVTGKLKEKRRMTREDLYELGFYSRVISSEVFRGRKRSSEAFRGRKRSSEVFRGRKCPSNPSTEIRDSLLAFLRKLPNIEELYLDILISLVPKNEIRLAAIELASSCPNIIKFTGIEDGEQFMLEYFEAVAEVNHPCRGKERRTMLCQINPRDYFWDIHHESIRKVIELRGESIKLSVSSKYIGREFLHWIEPSMISRLNVDMSVDEVQISREVLSSISQLTIDWNWARDRPVTSVKRNQFASLLLNAQKIEEMRVYEVPDSPQLLQQLSCLRSLNLKRIELHILNQGVGVTERDAIDSFLSRFGNQLKSFTIRCDYIKDRSNHGMDHLFRNSIVRHCRFLKSLELSYYISFYHGSLTLERYQDESLLQLLQFFPKTIRIDAMFPSDEQVERWTEEFKWYSDRNRKKNFILKFWRCSKYAISKKCFEETGPNWNIVQIIPDLSEPEEFAFRT